MSHPFGRRHSGGYASGALGAIFRGRISQARPHLGRSLRAFLIPCVYRICDFCLIHTRIEVSVRTGTTPQSPEPPNVAR